MHFLISNDDGITARGIQVLSGRLEMLGKVTVFAPDQDRSGASNSLTLDSPVRIREVADRTFRVTGTPSDCVHIALTGLLDRDPDIGRIMVIGGRPAVEGIDFVFAQPGQQGPVRFRSPADARAAPEDVPVGEDVAEPAPARRLLVRDHDRPVGRARPRQPLGDDVRRVHGAIELETVPEPAGREL